MAQKKHKKRKHNKRTNAQSAPQTASAASEEQAEPEKKSRHEIKRVEREGRAAAKAKKKEKDAKKGENGKAAKPGVWRRFVNYCKAVKVEMQRVVWPTRQELVNASLIVIGAIVFFGVYIAIIDNIIIIPLDWISSLGA